MITVPAGRYISTGSSIHAIDPSAKIVSFIALAFSSLFLDGPADFLVYAVLWTAVFLLSAVALREYLSTLWGIRFLLLLVVVFQSLFTPGRASHSLKSFVMGNRLYSALSLSSGRA